MSSHFTFFVLPSYPSRTLFGIASIPFRPYGAKGEGRKYVQGG